MGMQAEGGYRIPAEKSPLPVDLVCGRAFLLPTARTPDLALEDRAPRYSLFVVAGFQYWRLTLELYTAFYY